MPGSLWASRSRGEPGMTSNASGETLGASEVAQRFRHPGACRDLACVLIPGQALDDG